MRTLAAAITLLLFTACSRGAPDDVLLLLGDASPGDELVLERRLSAFCYRHPFLDQMEAEAEPFEELARTRADASGGFTFELYRAQVSLGGGQRACFQVSSPAHPRTELRTQFFDWDVRLPALATWDAAPERAGETWSIAGIPELHPGSLTDYRAVEWQLDSGGEPLWRAEGTAPVELPPEVFETFGDAVLRNTARSQYLDYDDSLGQFWATYSEADVTYRSEVVSVPAPAAPLTPLSRNALCVVDGQPVDACSLTDGKLELADFAEGVDYALELELRWSGARALRTLVIRGMEEGGTAIQVEVANGDGAWIPVTTLTPPFDQTDPDAWGSQTLRTPGRWQLLPLGGVVGDRLRLVSEGGAILRARELSIFE